MSPTTKTILMYALVAAVCAFFMFFPDTAFAQAAGGVIRGKLDSARSGYAIPIAIGIIAVGAIIAVIMWAFDAMDWKGMAKWIFAAMLVGVISGAIIEFAG